MKINYSEKPFEFLVIDNFLDETQKEQVWNELNFITNNNILNTIPSHLVDGSAVDPISKSVLAQRHSIFLEDFLISHRKTSKIYQAIKTNFLHNNLHEEFPKSILIKYLPNTNRDSTLVSFFRNGDYYKTHNDNSVISAILYLIPNNDFEGGDILFPEFEIEHKPLDNQLIVFPSCIDHEVSVIKSLQENDESYKRISITTFLLIHGTLR
jgi:hypothetical protein